MRPSSARTSRRCWPAPVLRGDHGRRVQSRHCGAGRGGRHFGWRALNLVAGMGESYASRVPVLALVDQSPTTSMARRLSGHQRPQRLPQRRALFSAVSVYCRRIVEPDDILTALPEAVAAARAAPRGVVAAQGCSAGHRPHRRRVDPRSDRAVPIPNRSWGAARGIGAGDHLAGEQVARDDARDELERLRAALHARIATVPDAKDVSRASGASRRWA